MARLYTHYIIMAILVLLLILPAIHMALLNRKLHNICRRELLRCGGVRVSRIVIIPYMCCFNGEQSTRCTSRHNMATIIRLDHSINSNEFDANCVCMWASILSVAHLHGVTYADRHLGIKDN